MYDPSKDEDTEDDSCSGKREQPHTAQGDKYGIPFDYQVKYRKLLGSMDCAEKSAVRLEPNKLFGYGESVWLLVYVLLTTCCLAKTTTTTKLSGAKIAVQAFFFVPNLALALILATLPCPVPP